MRFSLLLLLGGCPWIDAKELVDRLDEDGDGVDAVSVGGADCDDTDPNVLPGAPERCNGIDDDCDGVIDPDAGVVDGETFFEDDDEDGFGTIDAAVSACGIREGLSASSEDCDDRAPTVFPGAVERCNNIDDDCDGRIDEDVEDAPTWFVDTDADGFGDPSAPVQACVQPSNAVANAEDCAPDDPAVHPDTNWFSDGDGDGYGAGSVVVVACIGAANTVNNTLDCDDLRADLNPDTVWYADTDGDLYGDIGNELHACDPGNGWVRNAYDCDDTNGALNPDTVWYTDADGDGLVGTAVTACLQPVDTEATAIDCDDTDPLVLEGRPWWPDGDGDGWGTGTSTTTCQPPAGDFANQNGDCDDADSTLHPESLWGVDSDGDGYVPTGAATLTQCPEPAGHTLMTGQDADCDDGDASAYPDADEVCDTIDSDCDGSLDDPDAYGLLTWYRDDDGDGYGTENIDREACLIPDGYAAEFGDCAQSDPTRHPGAYDACYDDIDADCDGGDDYDCDKDGYTAIEYGGDDCDDANPLISPDNPGVRSVPSEHATLQEAIDLSCPGDLILLEAGTFQETAIADRPVHILGTGTATTILDGAGSGPVVTFEDGGTLEGLKIENGYADHGGCVQATGGELFLTDLELVDCGANFTGGAIYTQGVEAVTFSGLQITNPYASTGGGMALNAVANGSLTDIVCTGCQAASGAAFSFISGHLDVHNVLLDQPVGLASVVLAINVGGTWTDWTLNAPEAITPGLSLIGAGPSGDPLLIDGLNVWFPAASAGGTSSVWSDDAVDLTLRRLTQIGGEDTGPYVPANAIRLGVSNGTTTVSNARIVGSPGPTVLITTTSSGRIVFDHGTLTRSGGLILDAQSPEGIAVHNTVVSDSAGIGLMIEDELPVLTHVNIYNNVGGDWPLGTSYLGTDGNLSVLPGFLSYGPALTFDVVDVHLAPTSLLRNAGVGLNLDGTTADIGAYGGPFVAPADLIDTDGDGMHDTWELRFGLDPNQDSASFDPDGDGLNNGGEYANGTFPDNGDTDADGVDDGAEVLASTNPLDASSL